MVHIGEVHTTIRGTPYKIIGKNKKKHIIEFENGYTKEVFYCSILNKKVKSPYEITVYGVGYLGEHPNGKNASIFKDETLAKINYLWRTMIQRCYDEKVHKTHPSYKNCSVCERWKCFYNFYEDIQLVENYNLWLEDSKKYSLDKDIKQEGIESKVYSIETCMFVETKKNIAHRNQTVKKFGIKQNRSKPMIRYNTITKEIRFFDTCGDAKELGYKPGKRKTGNYEWYDLIDFLGKFGN